MGSIFDSSPVWVSFNSTTPISRHPGLGAGDRGPDRLEWLFQVASLSGQVFLYANREMRLPRKIQDDLLAHGLQSMAKPLTFLLGMAWISAVGWTILKLDGHPSTKVFTVAFGTAMVVACYHGYSIRPKMITKDIQEQKRLYAPLPAVYSKAAALGIVPAALLTAATFDIPPGYVMSATFLAHGVLWSIHLAAERFESKVKNDREREFLERLARATQPTDDSNHQRPHLLL